MKNPNILNGSLEIIPHKHMIGPLCAAGNVDMGREIKVLAPMVRRQLVRRLQQQVREARHAQAVEGRVVEHDGRRARQEDGVGGEGLRRDEPDAFVGDGHGLVRRWWWWCCCCWLVGHAAAVKDR